MSKLREVSHENRGKELGLQLICVGAWKTKRCWVKAIAHLGDEIRESVVSIARCQHGLWIQDPCAVHLRGVDLAMVGIRVASGQRPKRIAEWLQRLIEDVRATDRPPRTYLLIKLHRDLLRMISHIVRAREVVLSCRPRCLRQWIVGGNVFSDRAELTGRNPVIRKRRAMDDALPIRKGLRRIVDDVQRSVGVVALRKVAHALQCGRYGKRLRIRRGLNVPFRADEKERSIPTIVEVRNGDKTTQRRTPVVVRAVRPGDSFAIREEVIGQPSCLARLAQYGTVEGVGAGAQQRVEDTPAGTPHLRVIGECLHFYVLD